MRKIDRSADLSKLALLGVFIAALCAPGGLSAQQLLHGVTQQQCSSMGGRILTFTNTAGVGPDVGDCFVPPSGTGQGGQQTQGQHPQENVFSSLCSTGISDLQRKLASNACKNELGCVPERWAIEANCPRSGRANAVPWAQHAIDRQVRAAEERERKWNACRAEFEAINKAWGEIKPPNSMARTAVLTRIRNAQSGICSDWRNDLCDTCIGRTFNNDIARLSSQIEQDKRAEAATAANETKWNACRAEFEAIHKAWSAIASPNSKARAELLTRMRSAQAGICADWRNALCDTCIGRTFNNDIALLSSQLEKDSREEGAIQQACIMALKEKADEYPETLLPWLPPMAGTWGPPPSAGQSGETNSEVANLLSQTTNLFDFDWDGIEKACAKAGRPDEVKKLAARRDNFTKKDRARNSAKFAERNQAIARIAQGRQSASCSTITDKDHPSSGPCHSANEALAAARKLKTDSIPALAKDRYQQAADAFGLARDFAMQVDVLLEAGLPITPSRAPELGGIDVRPLIATIPDKDEQDWAVTILLFERTAGFQSLPDDASLAAFIKAACDGWTRLQNLRRNFQHPEMTKVVPLQDAEYYAMGFCVGLDEDNRQALSRRITWSEFYDLQKRAYLALLQDPPRVDPDIPAGPPGGIEWAQAGQRDGRAIRNNWKSAADAKQRARTHSYPCAPAPACTADTGRNP
jgi:hypothetical protein